MGAPFEDAADEGAAPFEDAADVGGAAGALLVDAAAEPDAADAVGRSCVEGVAEGPVLADAAALGA